MRAFHVGDDQFWEHWESYMNGDLSMSRAANIDYPKANESFNPWDKPTEDFVYSKQLLEVKERGSN